MAIEAELSDGRILEFPDGTKTEVIEATVKRMMAEGGEGEKKSRASAPDSDAVPMGTSGVSVSEAEEMPTRPTKKASVLEGKQLPKPEEPAEPISFGVDPKFVAGTNAYLDSLKPEERAAQIAALQKRGGVYAQVANTYAKQSAAQAANNARLTARQQQLDAATLGNKAQTPPQFGQFDTSREARTARLIDQGMEAGAAENEAWKRAIAGYEESPLPQMTRDITGEMADKAAAEQAEQSKGQGFWGNVGSLSRSRATQTGLGLMQIYADATGDKDLSNNLSAAARVEASRQGAIPQGESLFEKSAQGAMSSLATQAPVMLMSAMTGMPALALAQAGIDVFGSEYSHGRQKGLTPQEASERAAYLAAAEVVFERFGLTDELAAIRGVFSKSEIKKIPGYLAHAIAKEIPAEQLTSATQFLIDKAPDIGLNPHAGWKDFWENQAETLRQTVLQAGASSAGIVGTARGAQALANALPERPEGYTRDELQPYAYQMLAREKGFLTPEAQQEQKQVVTPPAAQPAETPAAPTAQAPTPTVGAPAVEVAAPTEEAETETEAVPVAEDQRIKLASLAEQVARISDTTGIPIGDALTVAKRRAAAESEALGQIMPTSKIPEGRVAARAEEYMDQGMPKSQALAQALIEITEEDEADALAKKESTRTKQGKQPVAEPAGASVPVAGQPSTEPAPAGAGVAESSGVVPAGQDVAGVEGGEGVQPSALTQEQKDTFFADMSDQMLEDLAADETITPALRKDAAEETKRRAASTEEEAPSEATQVPAAAAVQAAPAEEVETPPASVAPEVATEEVKRGRGRPKLTAEEKAAAEQGRKQQRSAANAAARNLTKAEELLQESAKPLDENDYADENDFASAQSEQRKARSAAIRTLYQISRENRNKPGQRAAEILKGVNPRELADAKAAYEYHKSQKALRSDQGAEAVGPADAAFNKVTNGAQALTHIIRVGNEFEKLLARRIRSFVGNVKIVVLQEGEELPEQLKAAKNARHWNRARGLYIENPRTRERTVYLRGDSFGDDQGVNTVTVLHELLHAATNVKLSQALNAIQRGFSGDARLVKAYADLVRTMNSAGQRFNELARQGQLPEHVSNLSRFGNLFEDPREFVAYGMTDPAFQDFLKGAHGYEEDTSFFSRFVDSVRRFFGMDEDTVNALSDLMYVTDKILSAPLTADMRLAEYGMPEQVSPQAKTTATAADRSKKRIRKDVAEAMHKVQLSRTAEEYANSISALHALKDPSLIIPVLKQSWTTASDNVREAMAAAPTFDFLARWTKDTVPELSNTNKLLEQMSGMAHQLLASVGRMSEDVVRAYKRDYSLRKKLEDLVYTATLAQVDPADPHSKVRDARLDAAYAALGTDGQRIYKNIRDYYRDMTEYYSTLLDKQIEDLDVSDETKKNLLAAVKTIYEGKQKIEPFFPLVRRGDFWLAVGAGKNRQFYMFETKAERDAAAKSLAAEKRMDLGELLDEKKFSIGNDINQLREASYQSSGLLRQIFDAIDNSNLTDPAARDSLKDAIYQIYLQAMPDQSFRRQFIHRKGIAGFSTDLLRNINTTGAKMSVQLARIKYGPLLRNSISQARESIAPTPEYEAFVNSAKNRVNAALSAGRRGDSVDNALDALAGTANKASYIWYLSGAASALIQPFSVYITGLPILTAHHGPKAAAELAKMVVYMNQYSVIRQNPDGTRSIVAPSLANNQDLKPEERRAIREMLERGVSKSTYASEVFGYKSTPSENLYFDPTRGVIDNIPVAYGKGKEFAGVVLGGLMHNTERLSREAIFLASYRLSIGAGKTHDEAIDQAVIDTNEALGNYDMTNRPLVMQKPGGKILLQFQMFPLHTSLLLLTNLKRMMPFLNKEGKAEAATKFFGVLGTAFSVAGLVGVPGFSAVMGLLGWAWKQFGKDDDLPEDLKSLDYETWFRTVWMPKHLGGTDMAALVERGPLNAATGLDFSSRLSLNNLWGRDTKETKTSRESVIAVAMSHAGPTASMMLSLADGWDAWRLGDTKKAVEKLSPAALRNVLIWKHMREEGVKDYRGARLMSPESIKTGELFGQLIGFRPELSADIQEKNFKFLGIENRIINERNAILTRLDNAYQNKDMKAYREAHRELVDFNKGFPSYEIDSEDLANSLEKKQEQRGKAYVGVIPTEKNVPIIEEALVQSRKRILERERKAHKKD